MRNRVVLHDTDARNLSTTDISGVPVLDTNIKGKTGLLYSTITPTRPTVTTTSSIILAANINRKNAGGFNQSGGIIFIKYGATAVAGEGERVPNNSPIIVPENYTGDVYAIRNVGSGAVDMWEGT